jgi:hypothetical protein
LTAAAGRRLITSGGNGPKERLTTPQDQQAGKTESLQNPGRCKQRGGPRRRPPTTGSRDPALSLTSQLAVTLLHQRLALPRHVLAWFTGTQPETISRAITTITPLLARHQPTITPAPARLRTPRDLIAYATAAGITLPPNIKTAR